MPNFLDESRRIVLVAEAIPKPNSVDLLANDLEQMGEKTRDKLTATIKELGREVVVYSTPQEFQKQLAKHENDLVLAPWSGKGSQNRLALMPAICEAAGIDYIGSDASTRSICNDKEISKLIARNLGFSAPRSVRLLPGDGFDLIDQLDRPVIVKPCSEGTSIGIGPNSVCQDIREVQEQVALLHQNGFEHVLVEEFIKGKEVCICLMGNVKEPLYAGAIELSLAEDPEYLQTNPYDARIKKGFYGTRTLTAISDDILAADIDRAKKAFNYFSRIQLFRVDGRLDAAGKFWFIEFATLPTFWPLSELTIGLSSHFDDYRDFISEVLRLR